MSKKYKFFHEKITFIYENICNKDLNHLTELFFDKSKDTKFESRKSHIETKWLDREIEPRTFASEYDNYLFRKTNINGKRIFKDADEFLNIEMNLFIEKINMYLEYEKSKKIGQNTDYKYIYTFNKHIKEGKENISYFTIEYLEDREIHVTPPFNREYNLEPYKGIIKEHQEKIIITFDNSHDYITAMFNTNLETKKTTLLVGIALGISDFNETLPVAKKVILTKEKVKDPSTLYLFLNETEVLSAPENSYKFIHNNHNVETSHLKKYIQKVKNIDEFFLTVSSQNNYGLFYEQLAFSEFHTTNKIFQKLKKGNSFHVKSRKKLLNIFLKSYSIEEYKHVYIVMPTYKEDNIFEHQSSKAISIKKKLIELSSFIDIEIIFVLKNCKEEFSCEFQTFLLNIHKKVKIYFTLKSEIEQKFNSMDFFFTDKKNFVVTKILRLDNPVFNIYNNPSTIDEHETMYKHIRYNSIDYTIFIEKREELCSTKNSILETLSGEWYHYVYGSKKLWEDRVIIHKDYTVDYYSNGKKEDSGRIVHETHQMVILLESLISKRLFTIVFDHSIYKIQKAFIVKSIAKEHQKESSILTIGIFSRKPIPLSKVEQILGNIDETRIIEKSTIDEYGYDEEV